LSKDYKIIKLIMIRTLIFLILLSALSCFSGHAQGVQTDPGDRKALPLRPNSREYVPVRRDNLHKRMDVKARQVRMKEAQGTRKLMKAQMKQSLQKKDHARVAKQNKKAIINQQKMMMRRRMRR
jgi:hypothetical protein